MPQNDAFILTLAYPETIVSHADEWYSKFLRFAFVGSKKHVRAGHAALVLIQKLSHPDFEVQHQALAQLHPCLL